MRLTSLWTKLSPRCRATQFNSVLPTVVPPFEYSPTPYLALFRDQPGVDDKWDTGGWTTGYCNFHNPGPVGQIFAWRFPQCLGVHIIQLRSLRTQVACSNFGVKNVR
jgi:hypothetical protein